MALYCCVGWVDWPAVVAGQLLVDLIGHLGWMNLRFDSFILEEDGDMVGVGLGGEGRLGLWWC